MKRIRLVLTAVVGAILFAFLYGCGEPNGQETEARTNWMRETSATSVGAEGAEKVAGGHSLGKFLLRDGTVYEGEVFKGQPSGQGTIINPNGTHQQGEWRHGKAYRLTGTWVGPDVTKEVGWLLY